MLHTAIILLAASSILNTTPVIPDQVPITIEKAIIQEFSAKPESDVGVTDSTEKPTEVLPKEENSQTPPTSSTDPELVPVTPPASNPVPTPKPVQPQKTDQKEQFCVVIGSYSTKFDAGNKNRTTNLRVAAAAINGTVLNAGQEFSLNQTVGQRTEEKGFKEAKIIVSGKYVDGMGGGVCQVSSTLFNAALNANMTITSRKNHTLKSSYVPAGRDATVAWGAVDFKFKNPYSTPVKIIAECKNNGTLSIKIMAQSGLQKQKITTKVTVQNGVYTLTRRADGKVNYVATSKYK